MKKIFDDAVNKIGSASEKLMAEFTDKFSLASEVVNGLSCGFLWSRRGSSLLIM